MNGYEDNSLKKILYFCEQNLKYWKKGESSQKNDIILAEGFFAEAGPNYVMRVGTIVKALEEKYKLFPAVLLRSGADEEPIKRQIWESFGFTKFIGIKSDLIPFINKIKVKITVLYYFIVLKILFKCKKYKQLRELTHQNVQFGDLLYDELTKIDRYNLHTVRDITKKDLFLLKEIFRTFAVSKILCKKYNIKYYVTTHTQYISYGLLPRYLKLQGIPVIETTDIMLFLYLNSNERNLLKLHDYYNKAIRQNFLDVYNDDVLIEQAKNELFSRFKGAFEQIDVKLAFHDKKIYSSDELRAELGIVNDYPIVFVLAHIFKDAPCGLSNFQIYPDYFQWLEATIKICSGLTAVNWVIKEHPSVDAYQERGEVAKLLKKYKTEQNTLFLCPDDLSTASIALAKAVVTAQGTAGMEFSCLGIPVVIASAPFYSGFGFTVEPKTESEYEQVLSNIAQIQPLTEDQQRSALAVYKSYNMLQNKDVSLIDVKVHSLVWGTGGKQDIPEAYDIVAKKLETINPKQTALYQEILEKC